MNFDFSEDQKHLRAEARKFLEGRCPPTVVRAVLDNPAMSWDRELWASLAQQGWLAFTLPEEHGGMGMGRIDLCVLAEELGRVLAPVPFASTVYILAEALMLAGSETQKERLKSIANGSCIGCLAVAEGPGELSDAAIAGTVSGGLLTGTKLPVVDGLAATTALVAAQHEGGIGLFLVDLADEGVSREALPSLDPSRDLARLVFDAVPCEQIGDRALLDHLLNRAAVFLAFEQVGGADRCLEQAVEYAKLRYAFGRPIGSQQAIKHKLADIYANNQIARSNAYYGAWALENSPGTLPEAAAAARVSACDAYWVAARESIHVHGGTGFTWEADQHLYYRRALQLGMQIGGASVWRERLVAALESRQPETN